MPEKPVMPSRVALFDYVAEEETTAGANEYYAAAVHRNEGNGRQIFVQRLVHHLEYEDDGGQAQRIPRRIRCRSRARNQKTSNPPEPSLKTGTLEHPSRFSGSVHS